MPPGIIPVADMESPKNRQNTITDRKTVLRLV